MSKKEFYNELTNEAADILSDLVYKYGANQVICYLSGTEYKKEKRLFEHLN